MFNNNVLDETRSLLKDIYDGKFYGPRSYGRGNDYEAIMRDPRYPVAAQFLEKHYTEGYGVVGLIQSFDLPLSYVSLRNLFLRNVFGFELRRGQNVVTDRVRKLRKERASKQAHDATSEWGKPQRNMEYTGRGIQGYYISTYTGKKHWLRSTYEYIYAKWLDRNCINFDAELRDFQLPSGEMYRPDFFLYDGEGHLNMIVEVKGYWKNKVHKPKELSAILGITVVIVTEIRKYTDKSYDMEKKEWKQNRLLD